MSVSEDITLTGEEVLYGLDCGWLWRAGAFVEGEFKFVVFDCACDPRGDAPHLEHLRTKALALLRLSGKGN